MQGILLMGIMLGVFNLIRPDAKKIDGIFEGRLTRARNAAIASTIADAINVKKAQKSIIKTIGRNHIFVSPEQVSRL